MKEETPWLPLDPEKFATSMVFKIGGCTHTAEPSIYDRPEAMRVKWNDSLLIVEFRYLGDDEPVIEADPSVAQCPEIRLWVGRNSSRIMRMQIDVAAARSASSEAIRKADRVLDNMVLRGGERGMRPGNYHAAKAAIEQNAELLVAP